MKYLHIMINEKFISPYIEFIEKNFLIEEHLFYIIGGNPSIKLQGNLFVKVYLKKFKNQLCRKIYIGISYIMLYPAALKSKQIILHGLFNPLTIVFLFVNPWFLKKCNWIMWGGDLYSYKKREKKSLMRYLYYKIEDFVKRNIGQISYLTEGDYKIAEQFYKVKGIGKKAVYINPVNLDFLYISEKKKKEECTINIQIGNSADPENNHLEIIKKLEKYKKENIKIFIPLSYGDKEYALNIKSIGEEKFGTKFCAMLEFLTPEKYAEYLSQIDILIFNHERQQGLANIFALSYLNKKIYMRKDISSWDYLRNDLGLEIYDVLEINKETFEMFKQNKIKLNKEKILKTVYSEEYLKDIWEENFKK